jgi:phage head maturation protease
MHSLAEEDESVCRVVLTVDLVSVSVVTAPACSVDANGCSLLGL